MTFSSMLDSAGRRRSPATLPGFHAGRAPRNKGMLYPADPPTVEEIVCVMRSASEDPHGWRLRAMIVMLWRGGLRVQEALALSEHDLDPRRGSVLVRRGRAGAGVRSGWMPGLGRICGHGSRDASSSPRARCSACRHGVDRGQLPASAPSFAGMPPRRASDAASRLISCASAHAVELAREGVSVNVIQRQLGHANLGTTGIYLQGIDIEEIISTVHARRAPMMSATAGLQL